MKLFVLAASVGYVMAAATGEGCGPLLDGDQNVQVDCTADDYCDTALVAPPRCYGETTTGDSTQTVDGIADVTVTFTEAAGSDAATCVAKVEATGTATSTGASRTIAANEDVFETQPAATTGLCANKIQADQTCAGTTGECAAGECRADGCSADGALKCGTALAAVDGALNGCCELDATTPVAVTDTAANYCSTATGVGTVTAKIADAAACEKTTEAWCLSGTCTVTDATADAEAGTCAATAPAGAADGKDGGACKAVITASVEVAAVTDCATGFTCTTAVDDAGYAADTDFCQVTIADAANTDPTAIDADAAAGTKGGKCTAAKVDAVEAQAACDTGLVCTGAVAEDTTTDAIEFNAGKCGPADDSPAAIFYGMSMVTAAVAYLL